MKNYIYIYGKKIPISDETVKEMAKSFKDEELESFEDCWNKVIYSKAITYLLSMDNTIKEFQKKYINLDFTDVETYSNHFPRKELARKVQLYIKLLTVAEAVNDGWTFDDKTGESYSYIFLTPSGRICIYPSADTNAGDIKFKNREVAQKAMDICPELWKEYLTIN